MFDHEPKPRPKPEPLAAIPRQRRSADSVRLTAAERAAFAGLMRQLGTDRT
ncbi:hypothetical protein U9R90_31260 [Streptomyces sp. E11-3]|uniref:hypothetical protein n=1 Tax=Streptomyces sp. E11-3 TaxID=3110112 RepID=UPI0039806A5F